MMLLRPQTMLLRALTRTTIMAVIISSTMAVKVAAISLVVAVAEVAAMVMAVGVVVVDSLTFSVKSVIKQGHEASYCYYRHDDNYVPTQPMTQPYLNQNQYSNQNPNQQWYPNQYPNQYQSQYTTQPSNYYNQHPNQYPTQPSNSYPNQYPNQLQFQNAPPQYNNPPPQAHLTSAQSSSQNWYPDSGASHHVTNVSQNIQQTTPFEGPDQIIIGNGQGLNINSSGVTSFKSPFNSQIPLVLNNLLFVPSITKNLMSVSQFCRDNSVFFEFHSQFCLVKSQVSKEVLLQGLVGADGLYQFLNLLQSSRLPLKSHITVNTNSSDVSEPVFRASSNSVLNSVKGINDASVVNTVSSGSTSFATWHSRLGHPSVDTMKLVFKLCNLPIINKTGSDFCSHCCIGKSHRLPSSPSLSVYSTPFELIYTDLWGPSPIMSSNGYKYYATFVDAYTRFTWLYLLKSKSDTLAIFKQFQTMVKTHFNLPIKAVQSDWGGEYRPFSKCLTDLGWYYASTEFSSYTPSKWCCREETQTHSGNSFNYVVSDLNDT